MAIQYMTRSQTGYGVGSVSLHFLLSVLLGVPEHLGDPVRAVHCLLLLIRHSGTGDVKVMVGLDNGHRFTLMEAQFAKFLL